MPRRFSVYVDPQVEKAGQRLDKPIRRRIRDAIGALAENPYPRGSTVKRLRSEEELYRLKVGDWRLPFRIVGDRVEVLDLVHRSEFDTWMRRSGVR